MSSRTVNVGSKSYTGEMLGHDPRTGDMHMRLKSIDGTSQESQDLIIRNGKFKIVPSAEAGPYLAKDGYLLFEE